MMNAIAPNSPGGSSTSGSIRSHKKYRPSAFDEALSKPLLQSPKHKTTTTQKPEKDNVNNPFNSSTNNEKSNQDGTTSSSSTSSSSGAFYSNKLTLPSDVVPPTKQKKVSLKKMNTSTNPFSSNYQPPAILSRIMTSTNNDAKMEDNDESKHDEETQLLLREEQQQQQQLQLQSDGTSGTLEEALLRERHSEAVEISRNMKQIRDISQDLATIVNDQQAQFDELEEDIDDVHDSAEQGLTQLQKANGYVVDRDRVVNSISENRCKVFIGFFAGSGLLTALVYLMNAFFL